MLNECSSEPEVREYREKHNDQQRDADDPEIGRRQQPRQDRQDEQLENGAASFPPGDPLHAHAGLNCAGAIRSIIVN